MYTTSKIESRTHKKPKECSSFGLTTPSGLVNHTVNSTEKTHVTQTEKTAIEKKRCVNILRSVD